MGKRGPTPTPTALKVIKGEKKSRINKREPQPDVSNRTVACPAWLSPKAKVIWRRLAPSMHRKKLLTEWDREQFAVYCEAVVRHRLACEDVARRGVMVEGTHAGKKTLVKNRNLETIRDQAAIMRGYASDFGLTPASRSGISMPEDEEHDEARRLLS